MTDATGSQSLSTAQQVFVRRCRVCDAEMAKWELLVHIEQHSYSELLRFVRRQHVEVKP